MSKAPSVSNSVEGSSEISISVPVTRFTEDYREVLLAEVLQASGELSRLLGADWS